MNAIRQTQQLNKRELENAIPPSASWHADYRDTAWVYLGGIPLDLSEGDIVTIFSQFGNPTHLNLIRDRETGKSKGFGFLKYEDQRSCDLAVDNLTGADVLGRLLRVDHTRYKKRDDEDEDTYRIERLEAEAVAQQSGRNGKRASDTEESDDESRRRKKRRPQLKQDGEGTQKRLAIKDRSEEEDSMRDYRAREEGNDLHKAEDRETKHKHHHRRHRDSEKEEDRYRRAHSRNDDGAGGSPRKSRDDRHPHSARSDRERKTASTSTQRHHRGRRRDDRSDDSSPERSPRRNDRHQLQDRTSQETRPNTEGKHRSSHRGDHPSSRRSKRSRSRDRDRSPATAKRGYSSDAAYDERQSIRNRR